MRIFKISLLLFILPRKLIISYRYLTLMTFLSISQLSFPQTSEWKVFNTQNSSVPQNTFYCIGIDTADNLWLAHHIICKWDRKNSECYDSYPYLGSDIVAIHGDSAGYVWLSLESHWIIKTDGANWDTEFLDNAMQAIVIDKDNILWGGGGLRALNGLNRFDGSNWIVFDTTNSQLPYPYVAQISSDQNGKIWGIAVGINGRALFSYDGSVWDVFPAYLPPIWVSTMAADGKGNVWYATALPQGGNEGIVQFNGTGAIFHPKPDSILGFANKLLVDSNDNLWVCWYNCVSEYSNGIWTVYKDTASYRFSDMAIDSKDNLWFSTWGDGVVAFNKNGLILSIDEQEKVNSIKSFSLQQNYPNPFNPVTKIKYAIPSVTLRQAQSDIKVTLKVYDLLGREVATLVNEEKPAGEYEVEFNAASHSGNARNLPSGIYFYQLNAGSYSETKKMILLR